MTRIIKATAGYGIASAHSKAEGKVVRSRGLDTQHRQANVQEFFSAADNAGKATAKFLTRQRSKLQKEQF